MGVKDDGDRLIEAAQKGATGSLRINTSYEYRDALNVKGLLRGQSDNVLLIHSHHDATCRGQFRMPAECLWFSLWQSISCLFRKNRERRTSCFWRPTATIQITKGM